MSHQERPNLELGTPPGRLRKHAGGSWRGGFLALASLQLVTLIYLLTAPTWPQPRPAETVAGRGSGEDLRAVALELENKSLPGEAARTWEQYLSATPNVEDRAEILYRVGKLHLQAEQYGPAATAFLRAEQLARDDQELRGKIGPQVIDCLRKLGLYGEVGRELSRRVAAGADPTAKSPPLATVAGEEISEADLDRLIERRVDQMLAMQGAGGDEGTRQTLLKQLSAPQTRERLLQEMLQREVFTRRARELKLDREETFLESRRTLEEDLLAKAFQDREVGKIQPTDVDLQAFFKAHPERYQQPESLTAVALKLQPGEDAGKLVKDFKTAEDFKRVAAARASGGKQDPPPAAPTLTLVRGQPDPQLGAVEPLFALAAGKWTDKPHTNGDQAYLVLVEQKTPAQALPYEQVRPQVESEYRLRKQQELAQKLTQELMTRYKVRVAPREPAATAPSGKKTETHDKP